VFKKTILFFIVLLNMHLAYAMESKQVECPMMMTSSNHSLVGVNVFEAKSQSDNNRYVLAPDNQKTDKENYLITQYWHKSVANQEGLKRYAECLYFNHEPIVVTIPADMTCQFRFISKSSDKGIIQKSSQARFTCAQSENRKLS
jgi:hypothetical protein